MSKVLYEKGQDINEPTAFDKFSLENITMEDLRAIQDLMELWEEGLHEEEDSPCDTHVHALDGLASIMGPTPTPPRSYKPRSKSFPILQRNPNIWAFVIQVTEAFESTNGKPRSQHNLSQAQR